MSRLFKVITLFILILASAVAVWWFSFSKEAVVDLSISDYAQLLVENCSEVDYKPYCYETELMGLTPDLPTTEIFDVIRSIRDYDPEYLFCHVAAHNLGQYEVSKDPNNWLDVLANSPTDGLCSNGYAHGAILARFNGETFTGDELITIIDQLKDVCEPRGEWQPTDLHKAMCYHGLGHVMIHVTETDVVKSLAACEDIALKENDDFRRVCREGVYMQLFQPLEPEDYALIDLLETKPSRKNIEDFCQRYSSNEDEFNVCWREAWPFFNQDLRTAEGVAGYCEVLSDEDGKNNCYYSAFTINGRHFLGQPEVIVDICEASAAERQGMCYQVAANAYLEEDAQLVSEGLAMCELPTSQVAKEECYGHLARLSDFNFHRDSEAFTELCQALPEKFQASCWD